MKLPAVSLVNAAMLIPHICSINTAAAPGCSEIGSAPQPSSSKQAVCSGHSVPGSSDLGSTLEEMRTIRHASDIQENNHMVMKDAGNHQIDCLRMIKYEIYCEVTSIFADVLALKDIDLREKYFTEEWDKARNPKDLCDTLRAIYEDIRSISNPTNDDARKFFGKYRYKYVIYLNKCIDTFNGFEKERERLVSLGKGGAEDLGRLYAHVEKYEETCVAALKKDFHLIQEIFIKMLLETSKDGAGEAQALEAGVHMALSVLLETARGTRGCAASVYPHYIAVVTARARLCSAILVGRMRQLVLLYASHKLKKSMSEDRSWFLEPSYLFTPINRIFALVNDVNACLQVMRSIDTSGLCNEHFNVENGGMSLRVISTNDIVEWVRHVAADNFQLLLGQDATALYERYFGEQMLQGLSIDGYIDLLRKLVKDFGYPHPKVYSALRNHSGAPITFPGYTLTRVAETAIKLLKLAKSFNETIL